jgi:hypothetical protein
MALLRFNDGTREQPIPKDKAYHIWRVLSGEAQPENEAQESFIARVSQVYLDRHAKDVPASYMKARAHIHAAMDAPTRRLPEPIRQWNDK